MWSFPFLAPKLHHHATVGVKIRIDRAFEGDIAYFGVSPDPNTMEFINV
jgi:hypothetical protein